METGVHWLAVGWFLCCYIAGPDGYKCNNTESNMFNTFALHQQQQRQAQTTVTPPQQQSPFHHPGVGHSPGVGTAGSPFQVSTPGDWERALVQVPLAEYSKLQQENTELRTKLDGMQREVELSLSQAKAEKELMALKLRQLVIQMQQLAGGDATTLNSWLEAACVSTADVERWTLGAIKAETWQHLHAHFSQVADKCTQQAAQLQSLTSGLEEANKEKERLATRLRNHNEGNTKK